jgi:hypothetical protein
MKRRLALILSTLIIIIIIVSAFAAVQIFNGSTGIVAAKKPFYVGVTFGGNTTADAKLLIDKVKSYTNLFVLQSGPLMANATAVTEIGDYAVANGLHFAAFFSTTNPPQQAVWVGTAEQRWGNMFAGIYYGDEPGGNMLDGSVNLEQSINNVVTNGNTTVTVVGGDIIKLTGGGISAGDTTYFPNGTITVLSRGSTGVTTSLTKPDESQSSEPADYNITTYYPNGTITLQTGNNFYTMENGTNVISTLETYAEVLSKDPIPNCNAAAENFVERNQKLIDTFSNQWQLSNRSFPLFTSDYALYWWDYQSGYDVVLGELGWNDSTAQQIALVRGAADMQNKNWGAMITWESQSAPYLQSGSQMYSEMLQAYESGAEYVVVFNYSPNDNGTGLLQNEHFAALKKFWDDVMQNPEETNNVTVQDVLILPQDYGCGMRNPNDTIWGLWSTNSTSEQIWTQLQSKLAQYGSKLDIVYDDPVYPVTGRYQHIYYWNQTT